jgi:hypothetical protein
LIQAEQESKPKGLSEDDAAQSINHVALTKEEGAIRAEVFYSLKTGRLFRQKRSVVRF